MTVVEVMAVLVVESRCREGTTGQGSRASYKVVNTDQCSFLI
jgi:hypothetical protein